jgi:ammonium transporter, Amt family
VKWKKAVIGLALGAIFLIHIQWLWSQDTTPTPTADTKKEDKKPEPRPDPSGAATGDRTVITGDQPKFKEIDADKPDLKDLASNHNEMNNFVLAMGDMVGKNRVAINMMWTLLTGFLVMFMQAGFALVETGLCRYKNVAHTMAMNFMVYALGMLGFWICGFAIMFGGYNSEAAGGGFLGGDANLLVNEFKVTLFGKEFGLFGYNGFFLAGNAYDTGIMTLFLFQMVFMDTTATIPTGAMAERWKFFPFVIYGFFVAMVIYPVFGNWVWGGGWLSKLGANFGLGHGHVDFAGSSVVHMVGGVTALAGAIILGPRLGKYNKDGSSNVLPAHSVPMYMLGTFILAFGWFGFNPGSTLAGSDLIIGRVATNTMLASAGGAFSAMVYMWLVYKKPDPSFMCNGMLAGLVAITAPCAFVTPWAAVLIGVIAGVLVIWSCLFWEKIAKVDDPVGAISVHGVNGAWGVLALGLFADGTYGLGWNGAHWYRFTDGTLKSLELLTPEKIKEMGVTEVGVTGLLYGNPSQFYAECIGVGANLVWVFLSAFVFFWIVEKLIGNRVSPQVELQGLDVPEMGVLGYINEDPKTPEGHVTHPSAEPRPATAPPDGKKRFKLVVDGVDEKTLASTWSGLCQPGDEDPPKEFLRLYPYMTTLQGNRFRFRGGDPAALRNSLENLLGMALDGANVSVHIEH